jgi:hypothetical protein
LPNGNYKWTLKDKAGIPYLTLLVEYSSLLGYLRYFGFSDFIIGKKYGQIIK